ncbi:TetR/AcrR family transcriptional regulator [Microbacterium yannicii]|uniref:TetR/AcrR family transcriptional regulator n=1 Tax=Microbacterium yannicii TaxID=671622 RepID=UPI0003179B27|nr:TetR/AcrR family transcriptional regulator [Microbacterium yannicii]
MEAIYEAAIELLTEGGWEAVTVGEIERRSGVSRGTFYLRFPTRDALVDYVGERMMAELLEHQAMIFTPLMAGGEISVEHAAALAVRGMVDVFEKTGRVMARTVRADPPPRDMVAVADLDRDVATVLRRGVGDDPQMRGAIEFSIELCFAALVARHRPVRTFQDHRALTREEFVAHLSDSVGAYLTEQVRRLRD